MMTPTDILVTSSVSNDGPTVRVTLTCLGTRYDVELTAIQASRLARDIGQRLVILAGAMGVPAEAFGAEAER